MSIQPRGARHEAGSDGAPARPSGSRLVRRPGPRPAVARRPWAGPRAGAHRRLGRPGPAGPRAGIPCRRRPGRAGGCPRAVLRVARMNARGVEVPPAFGARASRSASWATWLEGLPRLVGDILAEWELEPDGATLHGECALVVPVRTAEARAAALKVSWPHWEAETEHVALQRWHGDGAVAVPALQRNVLGLGLPVRPGDLERGRAGLGRAHRDHQGALAVQCRAVRLQLPLRQDVPDQARKALEPGRPRRAAARSRPEGRRHLDASRVHPGNP